MTPTVIRTETMKRLARNVRRCREARGLPQVVLAALVKMGRSRLNAVERGKQDVYLTTLVRLARVLKVPTAELLE